MKITKRQLRRIIKEEKRALAESFNSMSPRSRSLANAAKRRFAKDYPDIHVGIDGREGWITVNGNKAVNMSQASGRPLSMEDIIDQMKQAYLGHDIEDKYAVLPADDDPAELARHKAYRDSIRLPEGKMKITKRQLRRIIKEEKQKIIKEAKTIDDLPTHNENFLSAMRTLMDSLLQQPWNTRIQTAETLIANLETVIDQAHRDQHPDIRDTRGRWENE